MKLSSGVPLTGSNLTIQIGKNPMVFRHVKFIDSVPGQQTTVRRVCVCVRMCACMLVYMLVQLCQLACGESC